MNKTAIEWCDFSSQLVRYRDQAGKDVWACAGAKRVGELIHWTIAGSESGSKRRSMDVEWARSLRRQCSEASVPFFMKQMCVYGKVTGDIAEFPSDLRVREFPRQGRGG